VVLTGRAMLEAQAGRPADARTAVTACSRTGFLSVTAIPGIFLSVVTIYVSDLSGFVGQN
jgi:hypothetical protein